MYRSVLLCLFICFTMHLKAQLVQNDSICNGYYKQYNNAQLQIKGYFKKGKRHKIWAWYSVEGLITKQVKYKHGKPLWIIYYEQNKPWLKINRFGKKRVIRACECRIPDY